MDYIDNIKRWLNRIENKIRNVPHINEFIRNNPKIIKILKVILIILSSSYIWYRRNTLRARVILYYYIIRGDDNLIIELKHTLDLIQKPTWLKNWLRGILKRLP
ncbi:unnamed protein product [Rhizophagus irregularis]|uniref:Uncharacterized protein n=1 Tax=Rhizophagus irregularis TaxID=588596 RepID=A0A915YZM7_9GLOM|nr:unnamed protein product [Rhizophagus irregularis]CAB5354077.1 unnamed protein product [Rhizophagus irregularis]